MIKPSCWAPSRRRRLDLLGDLEGAECFPLPDTVYISDNLEAVQRQAQSGCGHLVFCAAPTFEKAQLLNAWQGCVLLIRTEQTEHIVQTIRERFLIEDQKNAMSAVLLEALTEGARVQTLVDAAYPFLRNPLVIFDSSYRIAGVTRQALQAQESQVTDMLLENGDFPAEIIRSQIVVRFTAGSKEQNPYHGIS